MKKARRELLIFVAGLSASVIVAIVSSATTLRVSADTQHSTAHNADLSFKKTEQKTAYSDYEVRLMAFTDAEAELLNRFSEKLPNGDMHPLEWYKSAPEYANYLDTFKDFSTHSLIINMFASNQIRSVVSEVNGNIQAAYLRLGSFIHDFGNGPAALQDRKVLRSLKDDRRSLEVQLSDAARSDMIGG
ncbi:hypothetical protein [Mycobacterium sp. E2989]|uniref:hypothetical protein n=1 Tax=Mycobacterium sp. E2989 TaxID=1834140 RepID=UPI0012E75F7E|nr:hypothetical protein [Mycobacterium sp. E2989]